MELGTYLKSTALSCAPATTAGVAGGASVPDATNGLLSLFGPGEETTPHDSPSSSSNQAPIASEGIAPAGDKELPNTSSGTTVASAGEGEETTKERLKKEATSLKHLLTLS